MGAQVQQAVCRDWITAAWLQGVQTLLFQLFEAIVLCCFLQCPCCCLHSEGCNGNLPLHFFPGFLLVCFAFNIKHGIIDPWEGLASILVVTAWSKDDMSVGKGKNVGILSKKKKITETSKNYWAIEWWWSWETNVKRGGKNYGRIIEKSRFFRVEVIVLELNGQNHGLFFF